MIGVNNVNIVSKAVPNDSKTAPKTKMIVFAGLVIGLIIGMGYAFIKELTDTTVKEDDFLTDELQLTNLGHVATIKMDNKKLATKPNHKQTNNRTKRVRV